ncbi:MAG: CHASE3 domain-containing protein [Nitrospira sp.]|nr:CHASE3 domain-containing protein [Nitrospira sp.]
MDTVTSDRPPLPPIAGDPASATDSAPAPSPPQPAKPTLIMRFRELTIERRILAGFSLVFIGILIIGAVSYRNTAILIENSRLDTKSHDLLQLLTNVDEAMDEAENNHRRYLVTGEVVYLKSFRSLTEQKPTYLKYLKELTAGLPLQENRVATLQNLIEQQINAETGAIAKRDKGGFEAVRRIALEGAAKREITAIHRIIGEMEVDERQSVRRRFSESTLSTTNTIVLLALGALLQLVLLASVYYLIRHDITARRKVATELQLRGELLEAANKELEAFSYSVSHDLRAPLRHIDGYASLLSKSAGDSLNDKAKRYLQTISDSAKQMGQLIDDLLVFSRMGRQEMLHTTVNLDQLIKTILYDLRLDLQGREISWTIDTLPEVPGDPAMLRQVFVNLISNALKFTGTRPIAKIAIGLEKKGAGEIIVFVRDNGVGFDMQYLGKLFGVFQRLHRADEFEGTGIGLANVRRIVHRHGGRVWAEGVPDQGATFFVALPTRRPRT